jgi:glycerophosphoryl diester phosphodiesterase
MKFIWITIFTLFLQETYAASCIAHRGYSSQFQENSKEAVSEAIKLGVDGVEIDILHTKDGVPIVLHDKNLRRVAQSKIGQQCPLDQDVSTLTYDQIVKRCQLRNGEDIPTFQEIVHKMEQVQIYFFIDLKDYPQDDFFNILRNSTLSFDNIRLISKRKKYLRAVNEHFPEIESLLINKILPRFRNVPGVNMHSSGLYLVPFFNWRGRETGVWTVNSKRRMRTAQKRGVDFITTDFPELCLLIVNSAK